MFSKTLIALNNLAVRLRRTRCKPEEILVLFSRCLQRSDCDRKLSEDLSNCQRCGRCFKEPSPLEQLKMKGYRFDDLQNDRWVFRSQAYLEGEPVVDDIKIELEG